LCEQAGRRHEDIGAPLHAALLAREQPRDPDFGRWVTLALGEEVEQAIRSRMGRRR
jgi:hypothetical protein